MAAVVETKAAVGKDKATVGIEMAAVVETKAAVGKDKDAVAWNMRPSPFSGRGTHRVGGGSRTATTSPRQY